MNHIVKIKSLVHITHDVIQVLTEKPDGYTFVPGQATEVSINKPAWSDKKNPFTFTCLPDVNFLEFTIKVYPEHQAVTNELSKLKIDDELILHEVFGAIEYMGHGLFIAGGAGVTPFISIFRDLQSKDELGDNKLVFANKKKEDIILEEEFKTMLDENFINILSDETIEGYAHGYITEKFLSTFILDIYDHIYLCGPPPMMEAVEKILSTMHIKDMLIVKENF